MRQPRLPSGQAQTTRSAPEDVLEKTETSRDPRPLESPMNSSRQRSIAIGFPHPDPKILLATCLDISQRE